MLKQWGGTFRPFIKKNKNMTRKVEQKINSNDNVSRRDYFAGMALMGFTTNLSYHHLMNKETLEGIVEQSVVIADRLIKELDGKDN